MRVLSLGDGAVLWSTISASSEESRMSDQALGMVECATLSTGAAVADEMLKTARVRLFFAQPVPPGRLVVAVAGEISAVESSVAAGLETAGEKLEDALFIPRLDSRLLDFLVSPGEVSTEGALGILETATVAAGIRAADAALKSARVFLVGLRLGRHIGGKAVVYLSGEVADVEAAVEIGRAAIRIEELDLDHRVIARPHAELMEHLGSGPKESRPLPGLFFSPEADS